jgi:hypothetical protein
MLVGELVGLFMVEESPRDACVLERGDVVVMELVGLFMVELTSRDACVLKHCDVVVMLDKRGGG